MLDSLSIKATQTWRCCKKLLVAISASQCHGFDIDRLMIGQLFWWRFSPCADNYMYTWFSQRIFDTSKQEGGTCLIDILNKVLIYDEGLNEYENGHWRSDKENSACRHWLIKMQISCILELGKCYVRKNLLVNCKKDQLGSRDWRVEKVAQWGPRTVFLLEI